MSRIAAQLLARQDPDKPYTLLTRLLVTGIIDFASLVYVGFFGVLAAVAACLFGVELLGWPPGWAFAPFYLSLLFGAFSGLRGVIGYWRYYGHG